MLNKFKLYYKYTLKHKIQYWWYKYIYNVEIGFNGTVPACFGKGKYVDVLKHGPYIEIINHSLSRAPQGMLRIIPTQYNHGFFLEYHLLNGNISWRTTVSYDDLYTKFTFSAAGN